MIMYMQKVAHKEWDLYATNLGQALESVEKVPSTYHVGSTLK
ncbi:hypothetical protein P5G51_019525 [Virgibacillus sp. 179-BFC.A HS]|uniref:Uncharacterized protein n=1 Tax=Tigheibacillus jepli TaxID=3035914 RepID=A0ABU5CMV6_9BACI|nr:hypothetical protein [Virgibacillus sp. 179-BFC.A HS]MDY0407231.1 hypothetical protein [Virgibacillus sp. 179-BFC.A HS]